uniref:SH2 domain-containing protein n=1 Tax=Macrostomum lignano TaxID=282301 RepID=A0A1I8IJJ5_9PLAT
PGREQRPHRRQSPGRQHRPAGSQRNAEFGPGRAGRVPAALAAAPPAPAAAVGLGADDVACQLESPKSQQFTWTGQAGAAIECRISDPLVPDHKGGAQQASVRRVDLLFERIRQRPSLGVVQQNGLDHRLEQRRPLASERHPSEPAATPQIFADVRYQTAEVDELLTARKLRYLPASALAEKQSKAHYFNSWPLASSILTCFTLMVEQGNAGHQVAEPVWRRRGSAALLTAGGSPWSSALMGGSVLWPSVTRASSCSFLRRRLRDSFADAWRPHQCCNMPAGAVVEFEDCGAAHRSDRPWLGHPTGQLAASLRPSNAHFLTRCELRRRHPALISSLQVQPLSISDACGRWMNSRWLGFSFESGAGSSYFSSAGETPASACGVALASGMTALAPLARQLPLFHVDSSPRTFQKGSSSASSCLLDSGHLDHLLQNATSMVRPGLKRKTPDEEDYDPLIDGQREWDLEEKLNSTNYSATFVDVRDTGEGFGLAELQRTASAIRYCLKIKPASACGVPSESFNVADVKLMVGARRPVDVMDVRTQQALVMTMRQWTDYYTDPNRDRILNVISLEFSHTKLDNYVESPTVVRQIDWIDRAWPPYLREKQMDALNSMDTMFYPKVRKYVLMSVADCYTDWHVDMGGTSVWYHILRGRKVFWLVPPTNAIFNCLNSGHCPVEKCQRVELEPGNTFFIPTGWMHAVYTPEDSLVFGGNYLHSLNIKLQLRVWELEEKTRVKRQFRFPLFMQLHWYVLARYAGCLMRREHVVPPREEGEDLAAYAERMAEYGTELKNSHQPGQALTQAELQGLRLLLQWLRPLPPNRREVPADLPEPDRLLDDIQELLQEHAADTPDAACTGAPVIRWPAGMLKEAAGHVRQLRGGASAGGRGRKSGGAARPSKLPADKFIHRRVRCRLCEPCRRQDCRECVFCADMVKYGGHGILKQCCIQKQCIACSLPAKAACFLCRDARKFNEVEKEEDNYDPDLDLFECGVCWRLLHPDCVRQLETADFDPAFVTADLRSDQMPNYWCCPPTSCIARISKGLKMLLKLESEQVETGQAGGRAGKENKTAMVGAAASAGYDSDNGADEPSIIVGDGATSTAAATSSASTSAEVKPVIIKITTSAAGTATVAAAPNHRASAGVRGRPARKRRRTAKARAAFGSDEDDSDDPDFYA